MDTENERDVLLPMTEEMKKQMREAVKRRSRHDSCVCRTCKIEMKDMGEQTVSVKSLLTPEAKCTMTSKIYWCGQCGRIYIPPTIDEVPAGSPIRADEP